MGKTIILRFPPSFLKKSKDAEESLYNTCLDGFARLRDVQSLEQTMVDLRSHQYNARPGAVTYGTLIKAYGTFRDFNRGRQCLWAVVWGKGSCRRPLSAACRAARQFQRSPPLYCARI